MQKRIGNIMSLDIGEIRFLSESHWLVKIKKKEDLAEIHSIFNFSLKRLKK